MRLEEFLNVIKRKLLFLIIVTFLITGVTYAITKYYIKPLYRASCLVIIANNEAPNTNEPNSYQNLVQTYAEFASTRKLADDVVTSLKLDISPTYVQSMIDAEQSTDSRFLTITVTSSDRTIVAPIANQVIASLKNVTKNLVTADNIQVIDEALEPTEPFSPNIRLNVSVAFLIGIMLSIGIIFLREYIDNTVKNEEELSELLGAPVLGVIPSSAK